MSYEEKCHRILDWAESNPEFQTNFVEKMLDKIYLNEPLTGNEKELIDGILKRYEISLS